MRGFFDQVFNNNSGVIDEDALDMVKDAQSAIAETNSGMVGQGYYTSDVILMDEDRQELSRISVQENKAPIDIHQMWVKSHKKTVLLYSISLPKDHLIARRARVGTVFIGRINWEK